MQQIGLDSIKLNIEQKILEIAQEFQQHKGLILTESDLKCLLVKKLLEIPLLSQCYPTHNPHISASPVHSELPWFDENRKLSIKPDLTILDPLYLSILHQYGALLSTGSKGCSFIGEAILFELKFIRAKSGITVKKLNNFIEKDIDKIRRLFSRLTSERYPFPVFCYFVIFNKTDNKCEAFNQLLRSNGHENQYKIIYASGNVRF